MEHEKIGQVTDEVKEIFNIVLEASDIKVNKDGLRSHMIKRHHNDVEKAVTQTSAPVV